MSGPCDALWTVEKPGWHFNLKASVSVHKLIELRQEICGSSLDRWEDGLRWRFAREGPYSLVGLFLLAPEGAGLIRLHVTYQSGLEIHAPEQIDGMRALAELAHQHNFFAGCSISCLWVLNCDNACKFRSLASLAASAARAVPHFFRVGSQGGDQKVIAWQKKLEGLKVANYCPLSCELCGLSGFVGSPDMAEHLASKGHELQISYLRLAEAKASSPLMADATLARQWLERSSQKWPRSDGTLLSVNHLKLSCDLKSFEVPAAYPRSASQSVFEC